MSTIGYGPLAQYASCAGDCAQGDKPCNMPDVCQGARLAGVWPYTGTPTEPGKLTEAELDRHIAEAHPRMPRNRSPVLPLAVTRAGHDPHPSEAVSGPHRHGLGIIDRLIWRWRVWRAERMGPKL